MKKVLKYIFLKLTFHILKNDTNFMMIYNLYQKIMGIEKVEKNVSNLHHKTESEILIRNLKLAFMDYQ